MKYSGHEDTFSDPLVDCKKCKSRWRADQLEDGKCPNCKSTDLTDPRPFNLMFKTAIGPVDDGSSFAYLRPETAQQIFVNFKNVVDSTSRVPPFGIAQIGKAFRNEITPRNFIFRVREFEQMELEYFVKPGSDEDWHKYWVDKRLNWWAEQGVKSEKLKLLEVEKKDLSHYSKATFDIMYDFPHGLEELEGIANRTDFDLGSHSKNQKDFNIKANIQENKNSTTKLAIQDLENKEWFIPFVIEPSAGVERGVLAVLNEAYTIEEANKRTLLKLQPHLSPIKAAVIPLKRNNSDLVNIANNVKSELQSLSLGRVMVENTGNIGKNYRRHDEIGTPLCITIDFETLENQTVTIRDRDTMKQEKVSLSEVANYYSKYFK